MEGRVARVVGSANQCCAVLRSAALPATLAAIDNHSQQGYAAVMLRRLIFSFGLLCLSLTPAAAAPSQDAQTAWRLLDYVAVDYGGAVQDGKVVSVSEYAEMREFSATVGGKIAALPQAAAKNGLIAESRSF